MWNREVQRSLPTESTLTRNLSSPGLHIYSKGKAGFHHGGHLLPSLSKICKVTPYFLGSKPFWIRHENKFHFRKLYFFPNAFCFRRNQNPTIVSNVLINRIIQRIIMLINQLPQIIDFLNSFNFYLTCNRNSLKILLSITYSFPLFFQFI